LSIRVACLLRWTLALSGLGLSGMLPAAEPAPAAAPASVPAAAPVHYISDRLTAPIRYGAAREQKIINQLKAGEQVSILERAPGTAFLRVRSASGQEGWIEAERVVNEPPALVLYQQLKKEFDAAVAELQWLKTNTPSQEQLQQQAHELQVRVVTLENEIERLTQTNRRLEERTQTEVMYAGALVMLVGLVIGWIVASLKGARRGSWS
jgi:SH3 domain protein